MAALVAAAIAVGVVLPYSACAPQIGSGAGRGNELHDKTVTAARQRSRGGPDAAQDRAARRPLGDRSRPEERLRARKRLARWPVEQLGGASVRSTIGQRDLDTSTRN